MINVSAIIPTYNRPKETAYCLELLSTSKGLKKDYELEVIVVDSSSDMKTKKAIEKFDQYFNLRYINLGKKTPPGDARNIAVKKAKNELIFSLDSDIEVKPDTLLRMIDFMRKNPRVGKMTGTSIFSSGDKKGQVDRPTKWDRRHKAGQTEFIEGIYGRYEMFYRSAFLKIDGYDSIFGACGEGTDMSIRFWRAGFPLAIDDEIVAYHNSNAPESLRRSIPDRMTAMYRSLFLVAYKYDAGEEELSPNFIKSHEERQQAYGNTTEFHSIISAARSIDWFKLNYNKVNRSKKNVPKEYDFKPFDIFSNKKLLEDCIENAEKRMHASYEKVFGGSGE